MTLKELKKRFCITEATDLGKHLVHFADEYSKTPVFVSEFVMRRKTTGKRAVRFRVYTSENNVKIAHALGFNPEVLREMVDIAALSAVRQVLDQI